MGGAGFTAGGAARRSVSRVLRGGSWYNDQDYARSGFRLGNFPYSRYYNIGFRVVCPSPSFSTER